MFKIEIKKDENITNSAEYKTEKECVTWLKENNFKTEPRKIRRLEAIKQGLDIKGLDPIIETEDFGGVKVEVIYLMFPPIESYLITDTFENEKKLLALKESEEALDLANKLKIQVRTLNKEKLRLGIWPKETFFEFIASPDIAALERSLSQASLGTYLSLLSKASKFYEVSELLTIEQQIKAHIQKWELLGVT